MTLVALAESYARRVQWEARVQATETVRALAEALGDGAPHPAGVPSAPLRPGVPGSVRGEGGSGRVSADSLLQQMGTGV